MDRLRPSRSAVGTHRCSVGEDCLELEVNRLDVIHGGLHPGANQQRDRDPCASGVGADVGRGVHAQREYLAMGIEREFSMALYIAASGAAQELFAAVGNPLDRPLQRPGAPRGDRILGVDSAFHAEAAPHVTHGNAHLFFREPGQTGAQSRADAGGHLGTDAHRETTVGGVNQCQDGSRLQRERGQTLVHDVQLHHMCRPGKGLGCSRDVAMVHFCRDVVRCGIGQ